MTRNGTVDALYRVQARLNELHEAAGLSWRDIAAQRAEFSDLSHATLRDIAVTGRASASTRRKLGLPVAKAIVAKMVVNERRSYRHGKRF